MSIKRAFEMIKSPKQRCGNRKSFLPFCRFEKLEARFVLSAPVSFNYLGSTALTGSTDVNISAGITVPNGVSADEAEPAIAVDPKDPARMFVAAVVGDPESAPPNRLFAAY